MSAGFQPLIVPLVVSKRGNLTADLEKVLPLNGQLDPPIERFD